MWPAHLRQAAPTSIPATEDLSSTPAYQRAAIQSPVFEWSAYQQYQNDAVYYGFFGNAVMADQLGAKLTNIGRFRWVERCLGNSQPSWVGTMAWAICGDDAKLLNRDKALAEVKGAAADDISRLSAEFDQTLVKANALGELVANAAAADPGIAAILAKGAAAKKEWNDYATTNGTAIATLESYESAMTSGNTKAMAGCLPKIKPFFEKLVRSAKLADIDSDDTPIPFFLAQIIKTPHAAVITKSYAACALSMAKEAEGLYAEMSAAGINDETKWSMLRGPRTTAIHRLLDASFKPRISSRDVYISHMRADITGGVFDKTVNTITSIMTPSQGVVAKIQKDGDMSSVIFKGDTVMACSQWKSTNKIHSVLPNGTVQYEQVCAKRSSVANETAKGETPSFLLDGVKPGAHLTNVNNFPVVSWQGSVYTSLFGVSLR
jgi:hypothetical protein